MQQSVVCCGYMTEREPVFLEKARESLAGAESEFANGRYNNCANRVYYACFQAAIAALMEAGIRPRGEEWSHSFVPAQFDGQLIYRRKVFATELRSILERNYVLRQKADYEDDVVTQTEASRALRRCHTFVQAVVERAEGSQ
jgi:uncharacterized protein (UPF0332 family)